MRNKLLIAAVMFLGLSAAAFAQATFSVGSIPVTAVIDTGEANLTGAVTFTVQSGPSVVGTITISYGVPITSPLGGVILSGSIAGATVNTAASSVSAGDLVINVPAGAVAGQTIIVNGVRVSVAGSGLTSLPASISAVGNAITAGQTSVIVINSIQPGIAAVNYSKSGSQAGKVNAVSGAVESNPIITVKEGFISAWNGPTGTEPGQLNGVGIRVTLSAAPQKGITVTFPVYANTDEGGVFQLGDDEGNTTTTETKFTSSSTSLSAYYYVVTATDNSAQEKLTINPTLSVSSSASLPLPSNTVDFTVSMAPVAPVYNSDGSVTGLPVPRFEAAEVGPATLYSVLGKTTTLLMPIGQSLLGFDTGIAIANTTSDPGSTAMGYTSATEQSGSIKFYFYQNNGDTYEYTTTAGSPGTGLDASGNVPAGGTYVVLLSELLAEAGYTGGFSGYVFAVTGFTNAHGIFVLSNFTTFSQGALMMVVDGARNVSVEALNN